MIPYGKQDINQHDINAVIEVLKSKYLTQGTVVPEFEKEICHYAGAKYGVAVNSATSALHIACLALGVGKGDMVWTSPISFVASANCALYCGADIDFIDIDEHTFNISASKIEEKLSEHRKNNQPLPKVIIPIHMAGQSCDMKAIHKLSQEYGFKIIEDASHAIGAKYRDQPVGNSFYSDITVFSFHPVKIITTGEGGLAVTNSHELSQKMRLLRSHGVTREDSQLLEYHGPWYYEQKILGFNYRLTEIQAALGLSQLERLNKFIEQRKQISKQYINELDGLPIDLPRIDEYCQSSWHLFIIKLNLEKMSKSHTQIFSELRASGLGVNLHYIPIYRQPYYQNLGFKVGYCPVAEDYYSRAISIPIFHGMTEQDQKQVTSVVARVLS